ncbi:MAG TPA: response regulator transcription factor [Chthonomonadales bacterium]|nr:response regulator transcription factor [Chthonomonadales bacterium]
MSGHIRILVADDHPVVREGLTAILESRQDMEVVAEAANGREAVELYRQHRPDIILMDLRMPVMDGVAATDEIRKESPAARIVLLTTYDADEHIYRGLKAGAKAYLLKDTGREELVESIRAVHAGKTSIPGRVAEKLALRLGRRELTARETEVLELLAGGNSNAEIGNKLFITEGTVKAHVNNILSKLAVSDRTQAVTEAIRTGIVSVG